jgi:PTS system nitrogen regulatory IIA component
MDISAVISEKMIFPCVEAENKRQLFQAAAEALAKSADMDKSRIFEALWERENLGPTGYGDGIAVPHARLEGLSKVVSVFMRLAKGIDFDAYDGKDVDLAAVIISPEQSGEDH